MMWNAGSPEFARNAVLSGRPIRGFVENAPKARGFSNHERPVLLSSPETLFNGRSMKSMDHAPLAGARESATTFLLRAYNTSDVMLCNDGKLCANVNPKGQRFGDHGQYVLVNPR